MSTTSVPRNTKELNNLCDDIKKTAGLQGKTLSPNDFEIMQQDINKQLPHSSINAKTLKRLFGYDKTDDNSSIRLYTLDILAKYIGFENWSAYVEHLKLLSGKNSGDFNGGQINASDLTIGDSVQITWNPNRRSVLKYLGNLRFEIVETDNSKWQVGDTFYCKHFILGKPLYVDNLTDKNGTVKSKMYVVGEQGGISVENAVGV